MNVDLRAPFPAHAWPRVWQWIQPFRKRLSDDYGPKNEREFVEAYIEGAKSAETWGVWRGDELGGMIWVERRTPVLAQSHVLFKPAFWGRGTPREAICQVYGRVYASGVRKIASCVFERNLAIRALARSLGAREEGLLREQTMQDGEPVNMIALGYLREDFEDAISAFGAAVDDGRERSRGRVRQPQQNKHAAAGDQTSLQSAAAGAPGNSGGRTAKPDGAIVAATIGAVEDGGDRPDQPHL